MGMRNYLVEGVSGTGKTSVCKELQRRGYYAIDRSWVGHRPSRDLDDATGGLQKVARVAGDGVRQQRGQCLETGSGFGRIDAR